MINWEHTKYGYELTSDKFEREHALLKLNPDTGKYYISCMDNCAVRIFLETDNLEDAKKATIEAVIENLQQEDRDIHKQIQGIEYLMCYGVPLPEEE